MTSLMVIDSSVAIKWCIDEVHSELALRIRTRYQAGDLSLIAPDLFLAEVANVAWKKCALRKEITEEQATDAVSLIRAASPGRVPEKM
ncbi:MAG: type II toxin-antitoxin system VapC family toxin [Candidatus Xenobia bacterium]